MTAGPPKRFMTPGPIMAAGVVSALCGTGIAHILGVADTPGPDWIELALQMLTVGVGVGLLAVADDRDGDHQSGGCAGPATAVSTDTAAGRRPTPRQLGPAHRRRRP